MGLLHEEPAKDLRAWLAWGVAQLAEKDEARRDAEILLCHCLAQERGVLFRAPEQILARDQAKKFESLIAERRSGRPLAHITGHAGFWTHDLKVSNAVLVPRPETELLVEFAHSRLVAGACLQVADLGTGSGAIALAVACERPRCSITAIDISAPALAVADQNRRRLGIANVALVRSDWLHACRDESFDLIVGNPPYIESNDALLTTSDIRFEPRLALASGPDGLSALRTIAATAWQAMRPGAWLALEHGYNQGQAVRQLFVQANFCAVETLKDLNGHERVSICRKR